MMVLQRDATIFATAAAPARWYVEFCAVAVALLVALALLVWRDRRGGFPAEPNEPPREVRASLGPSRLGLLGRFLAGFAVSGGLSLMMLMAAAGSAERADMRPWIWRLGAGSAFIACVVGSLVCAVAVTMTPRKSVLRALGYGVLGGIAAALVDTAMLSLLRIAGLLAGGALIGLTVGVADHMSREVVFPSLGDEE